MIENHLRNQDINNELHVLRQAAIDIVKGCNAMSLLILEKHFKDILKVDSAYGNRDLPNEVQSFFIDWETFHEASLIKMDNIITMVEKLAASKE